MGQYTSNNASPLMQMLQGILASGGQRQVQGNSEGLGPSPYHQYLLSLGPERAMMIDPQGYTALAAQQATGTGVFGPASMNPNSPGYQPTLPPGGGYPIQPPQIAGPNPPRNPGSQVRPPWMLPFGGDGPMPPVNPGSQVRPPWMVDTQPTMPPIQGFPFNVFSQQGPPAGVPQPNNAGPAAGSFVGQAIPQQKAINAMSNGNPMKIRKPGIL